MPSQAQRGTPPPSLVRLHPSVERDDAEIADLDISKMDENPITYFLTPAQPSYGVESDAMDFEMDFDAGIEDATHPPVIVRSVSPSSLSGLGLPPPPRLPTPPRRSLSPDIDRDMPPTPEDVEDYIHLAAKGRPHPFGLPFSLRDLTPSKMKTRSKLSSNDGDHLIYPAPSQPTSSSGQGRPRTQIQSQSQMSPQTQRISQGGVALRGRPRNAALRRRSPHAWREPSPDVWSIEEETEEEIHSDMGDSVMEGVTPGFDTQKGIDIPAAKPKKRVRFVLPDDEFGMY